VYHYFCSEHCVIRFCQELDVYNKKRKSDHQYFLSHPRRRPRPRDLEHLAISQSRSFTSNQSGSTSSPRDAEIIYRDTDADEDEEEQAATEDCFEVAATERGGGERYEESPSVTEYDNMAGDPARMEISRRGKLVTFYRNGDPHYKVDNSESLIIVNQSINQSINHLLARYRHLSNNKSLQQKVYVSKTCPARLSTYGSLTRTNKKTHLHLAH